MLESVQRSPQAGRPDLLAQDGHDTPLVKPPEGHVGSEDQLRTNGRIIQKALEQAHGLVNTPTEKVLALGREANRWEVRTDSAFLPANLALSGDEAGPKRIPVPGTVQVCKHSWLVFRHHQPSGEGPKPSSGIPRGTLAADVGLIRAECVNKTAEGVTTGLGVWDTVQDKLKCRRNARPNFGNYAISWSMLPRCESCGSI